MPAFNDLLEAIFAKGVSEEQQRDMLIHAAVAVAQEIWTNVERIATALERQNEISEKSFALLQHGAGVDVHHEGELRREFQVGPEISTTELLEKLRDKQQG